MTRTRIQKAKKMRRRLSASATPLEEVAVRSSAPARLLGELDELLEELDRALDQTAR